METSVVQEIPFQPGVCCLCRAHNPPHVLTRVNNLQIHTPDGARVITGTFAICIGDADHPGCLTELARAAGGKGPSDVAADEIERETLLAKHNARVENLELELGEALANQGPQVVRVDELLEKTGLST